MITQSSTTSIGPSSIGTTEGYGIDTMYDVVIREIFKTLVAMENDGVITHRQFLHYAKISEEEYVNLALTIFENKGETNE